jgi:iron-sulfur cluster assembly protein
MGSASPTAGLQQHGEGLVYLAGSEIDYVDDLLSASFKIKNPNATAACGCGTSFSV